MSRSAGVYVRISSDPTARRLGVKRQLEDCQAKARALGWRVARVYEDNDRSATNGDRPAYQQLLEDAEAGVIDAVVVWDLDRLHRRPVELEHFLDLADRKRLALASVGGDVDLATDNGRLFARIKGAVAKAEVERKSARQKRANLQRAQDGKPAPGGRRAFGYRRDGVTVVKREAAAVRRAADTLLAGGSIHGITRQLNASGLKTTAGNQWRTTEVRRMLLNPRYAGLRVYQREVIGPGAWPAILDEDTHHAICGVLSDPARHKAGPPRRFLLSGVARCGVCDGAIFGATDHRRGGPIYRCESRAHVCRRAEAIEDMVEELLIARLSRPDAARLLTRSSAQAEVKRLRAEDARIRARLDALAEAFAAGEIDRRQLRAGTNRLRSQLDRTAQALAEHARTPVLADLATADDVRAVWAKADIDRKRAVIALLLTVTLHSPGRGARTFDPDTVDVSWRTP